jgi:hypothetical protein
MRIFIIINCFLFNNLYLIVKFNIFVYPNKTIIFYFLTIKDKPTFGWRWFPGSA